MKKTIFCFICVALLLTMGACSKKETDKTTDTTVSPTPTTTVAETTTASPEETTAPKPKDKILYVDFYEEQDDGGQTPYSISDKEGTVLGAKFTADGYWIDLSMNCPSWSNDTGTMTFAAYNWNTDYATTVAGTPVYTTQIVDYVDNSDVVVEFDGEGLPAGEYLWILKDGTDGVGIWGKKATAGISSFKDGQELDAGFSACATVKQPAE